MVIVSLFIWQVSCQSTGFQRDWIILLKNGICYHKLGYLEQCLWHDSYLHFRCEFRKSHRSPNKGHHHQAQKVTPSRGALYTNNIQQRNILRNIYSIQNPNFLEYQVTIFSFVKGLVLTQFLQDKLVIVINEL